VYRLLADLGLRLVAEIARERRPTVFVLAEVAFEDGPPDFSLDLAFCLF
jgi:hypothetical protein